MVDRHESLNAIIDDLARMQAGAAARRGRHADAEALLAGAAALLIVFGDVLFNLVAGHRPLVEGSLGTHLIKKALELFESFKKEFPESEDTEWVDKQISKLKGESEN